MCVAFAMGEQCGLQAGLGQKGFLRGSYCLSSLLPGIKEKKHFWALGIYFCLVQLHQTYGSLKDA